MTVLSTSSIELRFNYGMTDAGKSIHLEVYLCGLPFWFCFVNNFKRDK